MGFAPAERLARVFPRRRCFALAAGAALTLASAGLPVLAFEIFGHKFFEKTDETVVVPDAQPYTLTLTVAGGDKELVKVVDGASTLARQKDHPPPGTAGLIARARGDYGRILAALYAEGYYGGSIDIRIEGQSVESLRPDTELPDPVPVTVSVDPGPLFHFGKVKRARPSDRCADTGRREGARPRPLGSEVRRRGPLQRDPRYRRKAGRGLAPARPSEGSRS